MRDCRKPAVGHNLSFDLTFSLAAFAQQLPQGWAAFKHLVQQWLPGGVWDTKLLARQLQVIHTHKASAHGEGGTGWVGLLTSHLIPVGYAHNRITIRIIWLLLAPSCKHATGRTDEPRANSSTSPHTYGLLLHTKGMPVTNFRQSYNTSAIIICGQVI